MGTVTWFEGIDVQLLLMVLAKGAALGYITQ